MNDGQVCISICAKTATEFSEKMNRAAEFAELLELRFDCLDPGEIPPAIEATGARENAIITFRPANEGGSRELTDQERLDFHESAEESSWVDLEFELANRHDIPSSKKWICSFHDIDGVPNDLSAIYRRIRDLNPGLIKIAVSPQNYADAVRVWDLLKLANSDNVGLIPIAMGEFGVWTRVLGLARGVPITYGALSEGERTAPGQISAADLNEVYRVKELDHETEVYGVIGDPVSQSMSPFIHNHAFSRTDINAVYIPFYVNDLHDFLNVMVEPQSRHVDLDFRGFSVTAPHKTSIIGHLDFVDQAASEIGAVNTVQLVDDALCGFNTDAFGFLEPLRKTLGDLKDANVALIGSGGATRAAVYSLSKVGADMTIFARNLSDTDDLAAKKRPLTDIGEAISGFDIVVNCTPLGMKGPLENETPLAAEQLKNVHLVYDLVYNPIRTRLLREAEQAGTKTLDGFEMFLTQASEQQKIWTGNDFDFKEIRPDLIKRLK